MPKLGTASRLALDTCHPDLILVIEYAIVDGPDFSVLEGHRGEEAQEAAFAAGTSDLHWPDGNHNLLPSLAADIAPWPLDWLDTKRFHVLAGYVLGIAYKLDIALRWGGDWDGDWQYNDQKLHDLPHLELRS